MKTLQFLFATLLIYILVPSGISGKTGADDDKADLSINIGTININMNSNADFRMDKLSSQILQVKESLLKLAGKVDRYHPSPTTGSPHPTTPATTAAATTASISKPTRAPMTTVEKEKTRTPVKRATTTRKSPTAKTSATKDRPLSTGAAPSSIGPTTTAGPWIFYPPDTHEHRVRRVYPNYGYIEYTGFGEARNYSQSSEHHASSLEDCVKVCYNIRNTTGVGWNAVTYKYDMDEHFLRCACREGATGFIPYSSYLHYKFPTSKPTSWIYYPPGTKDHKAKSFYPEYDLKYVGFGAVSNYSQSSESKASSFEECIGICVNLRKEKGESWNALTFMFGLNEHFKRCACQERANGFLSYSQYLHYNFQSSVLNNL